MSSRRISGKDFYTTIGDLMIKVESASLSISDNSATTYTQGIPNGHVDGDASASGDITLDTQNFNLLIQAAKKAGSWKKFARETFDMQWFAQTDDRLKVEAFGCLMKIDDLLDLDSKGGDKTTHKISYEVTDKNFVKINGVPYLEASELIGVL